MGNLVKKKYSSRTPFFAFSISLQLKEDISLWVCWSVPFHELKPINCEFEIRKEEEALYNVKVMQHTLSIGKMFFLPAAIGFRGEG